MGTAAGAGPEVETHGLPLDDNRDGSGNGNDGSSGDGNGDRMRTGKGT